MAEIIQDNPKSPLKPLPRRLIVMLILISAGLIIGVGYWYSHNHTGNSSKSANSKYAHHYNQTSNYVLKGRSTGLGVALNKPPDFIPVKQADDSALFVQLAKLEGNQPQPSTAYLLLKSRPYPTPKLNSALYKDNVKSELQKMSGTDYHNAALTVEEFTYQLHSYGEKVNLTSSAKPFTNNYIKDYAWQFDTTATDNYNKGPAQQGKAIYILGQHAWYYLLLTAEKNNWQGNSAFFQKMLNSLRVDQ